MRTLEPGDEIAGYRIEGIAGRGGMGVVYRATQLALERDVALKVIAPEFAADPEFRRRFERESRMAASIRHPNVIAIHDAREDDGLLFITMEYVEGTDLREVLAKNGRLAPGRAVELVSQVASALDAAHGRGLVHRDVKPANVLLAANGAERAYLTDFGLSKATSSQSSLTHGGMVGTTDYAAPEQLEGGQVDARTDVYALTCVLFQALTGRVPFARDTPGATMFAHFTAEPPSVHEVVPELPAVIDEVVGRGMAKGPDERYPSAGDLATAARAAVEGRPVGVEEHSVAVGEAAGGPPEGKARRAPRSGRGRWMALVAGCGAVALLLGLLLAGVFSGGSDEGGDNPAGRVVGKPIRVMPQPQSIDVAGRAVWVGGGGEKSPQVRRVDATTGAVGKPIRTAFRPLELFVGAGAVWANTGDSITRIDPRTGRATRIRLPRALPRGALEGARQRPPLALAVGGGEVWVANGPEGTVSRLDPDSNRFGRPIRVGRGLGPITVAGRTVFVGVDRTLRVIDRDSGRLEPGPPIQTKKRVVDFELARSTVFALEDDFSRTGALAEPVDADTGIVGRSVRAREGVVDFTVGGGSGWASYAPDGTVDRIELVTRRRIGRPIRIARGSSVLAFGAGRLWAANLNGGTLRQIEP